MAFPLFFLALAFSAGIGLGSALDFGPGPWAAAAALLLASAWALFGLKKTAAAFVLVLAAGGGLGAGWLVLSDERYEKNGLRELPAGTVVDLRGTVIRSPGRGLDRDSLTLRVQSVEVQGQARPVRGVARVSIPRSSEFPERLDVFAGDRVTVSAQISLPREYRNFSPPFSRVYLRTLGLHVQASTKSLLLVRLDRPGRPLHPLRLISRLRQALQKSLERYFPRAGEGASLSSEGAVLEALLLGERGRLDADTTRALQQTGLFHLFAISGAHIGIISFLVFALLRAVRLSARASYLSVLVLLLVYALLVEGRSSVVRAVIMAAAFILGKLLWKDAPILNTLGLSALLILLLNPFQLFDLGFQLTFAATLGIILFFPRLKKALPRLPLKVADMFGLSLAAQAAVLPLVARSFNRVIFSGLFLNLIGIPLVGLVMAAGYVFLPLSLAAPFIARPAAAALTFLVKLFMASAHLMDGLPFLSYRIPTPSGAVVAAYFAGLLALLLPSGLRAWRRAGAAVGFAAFLVLATYPFPSAVRDLTVTFIDVGHGDAVLVEFPGRAKMLVDGGGIPFGSFDVGENVVSPFLWDKGVKRLDLVVLTHPHPDHLFGLASVASNFRVGRFWETAAPPASGPYDRLKRALRNVPAKRVARGEKAFFGGVSVDVLSPPAPPPDGAPADNDLSMVIRLSHGQTSVLLPADIETAAESEILAAGLEVGAQVLKSPHHGSDSSSSAAFLARVKPDHIVVSVGRGNASNLPHPDVLERYRSLGAAVFRTDF
ncbi:MAG: DNA internalization-related competence protein ComEC/Rec2, partial [Candidatus Aminicenantes bacterium]|nr:DNA internalization-related competence protein ComEC/Rec2 [Candidatus Aminicenantes bacterium]